MKKIGIWILMKLGLEEIVKKAIADSPDIREMKTDIDSLNAKVDKLANAVHFANSMSFDIGPNANAGISGRLAIIKRRVEKMKDVDFGKITEEQFVDLFTEN